MLNSEMFNQYMETKDIAIRNKIVEENLYLIDILIRKYLNKGVEYDDLYQVGAMALVSAVERFDPSKGYEFSSFATPTILGEIKKYFRDKKWVMKVPRRLKEISVRISKVREEMFNELQRNPTIKELAERIDLPEEELMEALESSKAYDTYSLNQTFEEDGEGGSNEIYSKYASIEEEGYSAVESSEIIKTLLAKLNKTDKIIFRRRFIDNKTQGEVAKELGLSQMSISRFERSIKRRFFEELFQ